MAGGEWRVDPTGRFEYRWFDGSRFTEWVATGGEQTVDPGPIPAAPTTVEVGFGSPARQNRWTIGFRLILAIPHFVWITLVTLAALPVLVIGWFAALFTARLPAGIHRFLHRVLQYHVRLLAYVYLLRGDYPPFRLSDTAYPVVAATVPSTLNRWAVLFRLVLVLPVLVVANWLSGGLTLSMIVIWVVVLAKGRMPAIVAQAVAAVIRFEARTYGYAMLLATAYPAGLYGDPEPTTAGSAVPPDAPPSTAKLHLARGARRLVTVFLVVGILQNVVSNVANWRVEDRGDASAPVARR